MVKKLNLAKMYPKLEKISLENIKKLFLIFFTLDVDFNPDW